MTELFRGFQNWIDPSGKPKRDLDAMIDGYAKGGEDHAKVAKGMREVLMLSPDLNARMVEAVRDGHLTKLSSDNPGDNAAAGYNAHSRTMFIRPGFNGSDSAYAELMFTLGHETDHARSLKGQNHATSMLGPEVQRIAAGPSAGPRDYTPAIGAYVELQRKEEAQAHIGGFNAISSYAMNHLKFKKGEELETIYKVDPMRMGDFISVAGDPAMYALKPGLEVGRDFQMPKSEQNVNAMKGYYADKMINGDYMMYRQEAIKSGMDLVGRMENVYADNNLEDRRYIIDPGRLQAHRTLNLPQDGLHEIKGAVEVVNLGNLGIDVGALGPLVADKGAPKPAVSLVPSPGDHPLFAQALTRVAADDEMAKIATSPNELRKLAAVIAVEAQGGGLGKIDGVMLNKEKTGIILTEGVGDRGRNILVDGQKADAEMKQDEMTILGKLKPMQMASSPLVPSEQQSHVQSGEWIPLKK